MTDMITKRLVTYGAAREVLVRRESEVLLCGPAGTGKSFSALWKVHLMCMLNPGMRALMVRKTHKSLTATGLVTFREHVAKEAIAAGICRWYGGSGEKPAQYIYNHPSGDGAVIVVGGLDNADKIMSAEYDLIYVQEATDCTLEDWDKLGTRLRNGMVSFQQLLADCNPQQPSHWLKKRCDEGKTVMLYSRHEDNPRLFERLPDGGAGQLTEFGRVYINRLDALTGVRKERLRHGRWAAAEGLIYENWMPDVHLIDRKRLPQQWHRYWTVDFGFIHPFVWQQWAVDEDGRLYLEREIYRTKRIVEDHAKDILRTVMTIPGYANYERRNFKRPTENVLDEWKFPRPRAIICDHDAEDRATLERHLGMGTVAAHKSVSDGIQAMQARLKVQKDGKPRLFVCRDALVERDEERYEAGKPTWFGEEVEGYIWKPKPNSVGGRERPEPDEPEKIDDDSMDAARYMIANQDLASRPGIRWL